MSSLLPPLHLLSYSTLLGTQLYQSFVLVKVAHRALPPDPFTTLQKRLFPIYFRGQALLLGLTALTVPGGGGALGGLVKKVGGWEIGEWNGDWILFVVAGVAVGLDLVVYGPRTSKGMMVRRMRAASRDKSETDAGGGKGVQSLKDVDRAFAWNHAICMHLNLISIGATLWYGWRLAAKMDFGGG